MKNDPDAVLPLNYRRTTVGTGWQIPSSVMPDAHRLLWQETDTYR